MNAERTKLEILLFERGLSIAEAARQTRIPQKRLNNKIHRRVKFNLPEMKAIQTRLFPEMTLEEIFEGY